MKAIKSMFKRKEAPPPAAEAGAVVAPAGFEPAASSTIGVTPEDAEKMTFRELNSKVARSIAGKLDARLRPVQLDGIKMGLKKAKEMFRMNSGHTVEEAYRMGKLLGAGAFAKVFEGAHRITGDKVAIKVIAKTCPTALDQRPGACFRCCSLLVFIQVAEQWVAYFHLESAEQPRYTTA